MLPPAQTSLSTLGLYVQLVLSRHLHLDAPKDTLNSDCPKFISPHLFNPENPVYPQLLHLRDCCHHPPSCSNNKTNSWLWSPPCFTLPHPLNTQSKTSPKILLQFVYSSLLPLLQHRPPHLITPLPLTYNCTPNPPRHNNKSPLSKIQLWTCHSPT